MLSVLDYDFASSACSPSPSLVAGATSATDSVAVSAGFSSAAAAVSGAFARLCRFCLIEHDLCGYVDGPGELERLAAEEAGVGFDLEAGPLIRGRLIRLSNEEHVLLITMHHIVSDGWSMGIFVRELSKMYDGFVRGKPTDLPKLEVQYADYAVWQRQWMEGEILQRQADFWKTTWPGCPPCWRYPPITFRPREQDYSGGLVELELDAGLSAGLKELSRRQGTTLYMTLLAGWAALLSRLSGQQDVVIGTPVANRGRVEIEGLIGFFCEHAGVAFGSVRLADGGRVAGAGERSSL